MKVASFPALLRTVDGAGCQDLRHYSVAVQPPAWMTKLAWGRRPMMGGGMGMGMGMGGGFRPMIVAPQSA